MASRWLSIYFPWLWKERNSSNKIVVLILISEPKISNLGAPATSSSDVLYLDASCRQTPPEQGNSSILEALDESFMTVFQQLFMTFHENPWFSMIFHDFLDFSKIFSATPLGKRLLHIRSVWIFYEGPRAIFPTCSQTCKWKWRGGLDWLLKVVKQDHLRMNVALGQTIILGLQIFLDHRSLRSNWKIKSYYSVLVLNCKEVVI